jgi:8-oxo-dGTP diphosphatase
MKPEIHRLYGNKIRVRVCGLCWQKDNLLLANHKGLTTGDFWAPPGGGLEFGESVDQRLQKEFLEETGLRVSMGPFRFACEFINQPLHAIELFFEVAIAGGVLEKGDDPEMTMIEEVRFMSGSDIARIPAPSLHGIFSLVHSPQDLKTLNGFFTI